MNNPMLIATKIEQLALLAKSASNEYENAAVFAAIHTISELFNADENIFSDYILENVEKARWSISAAIGYDVNNDHDKNQHVVWAIGAAKIIQSELEKLNK